MKNIGSALLIFGIGTIALTFADRQFVILDWIDQWGPEAGWGIKIGMAFAGIAILTLGPGKEQDPRAHRHGSTPAPARGRSSADPLAEFYNKPHA